MDDERNAARRLGAPGKRRDLMSCNDWGLVLHHHTARSLPNQRKQVCSIRTNSICQRSQMLGCQLALVLTLIFHRIQRPVETVLEKILSRSAINRAQCG